MAKLIRIVQKDTLNLARYYRPLLIDLDNLRSHIPQLSSDDDEAVKQLWSDFGFCDFIEYLNNDDLDTVTDPKGKGQDHPESSEIYDMGLYDENDTSWRWLFDEFRHVNKNIISEWSQRGNFSSNTPSEPENPKEKMLDDICDLITDAQNMGITSDEVLQMFKTVYKD